MSNKVIKMENLPTRLPVWSTITCWLALDHWSAPQWLCGSLGLFFLAVWIYAIQRMWTQESVDIFKDKQN